MMSARRSIERPDPILATEAHSATVAYLDSLSPARRRESAAAGEFNRRQLMAWAALHPEEIPLIGGELPWIAVDLE